MRVLVIDNYDSFTYNLVHLLRSLGVTGLDVRRNDRISIEEAAAYDRILLSPGPGIPLEAGIMPELVRRLSSNHSILGVCLGHQCIGEVFGALLVNMERPVHGKAVPVKIMERGEKLFAGMPARFKVGRYHSWIVSQDDFPACLQVTAADDDGNIMALSHREYRVKGVQFHPESILTEHGERMLKNWLDH